MRSFKIIRGSEKTASEFSLNKLKQNSVTLIVVAILLICCVTVAPKQTVFTSASIQETEVFVFSYSDSLGNVENFLHTLEDDLIFLRKNKCSFTLPRLLREGEFGNTILIIERKYNEIDAICRLLMDYEAKAVFELTGLTKTDVDYIKSLLNNNVEFAGSIDGTIGQLILSSVISDLRIELMSEFGINVSTFLRKTDKFFVPSSEFNFLFAGEHPFTLLSFGNGKNRLDGKQSSRFYMTRIYRLSEWSIGDYFSWTN